jgi:uncharacterized protein
MVPGDIATLHLVLTRACNLRCGYCYQRHAPDRSMSWTTLRAALEWGLGAGGPRLEIVFSGGEPLLELPLIRRAVAHAAGSRPARLTLLTNGTLLDDAAIEFCARHAFDVQLSCDGVPEAQEARAPGTFEVLDARLARLTSAWADYARQHLTVGMTVTPPAVPRLADSVEHLLGRGVRRIALTPAFGPAAEAGYDERALEEQFVRLERIGRAWLEREGHVPLLFLQRDGGPGPGPERRTACGAACGIQPAVDVDGQVYPCALLIAPLLAGAYPRVRRAARRLRIGPVTDPAIEERRRSFLPRAARARLLRRPAACGGCAWVDDCGVCPVAAADAGRGAEYLCAFARAVLGARRRFPVAPDGMARFLGVAELPEALRRVKAFGPVSRGP